MKFGIFYELSVPRPWTRESERDGLHERARAGAPRRRAGLRPGLVRRAPLPRGVLALLGAGAVPHGLRDADEEHPRRARHRRLRAAVQPPDPHRRARRRARHPLRRPARGGHRPLARRGRSWRASRRTPTTRRRRGTRSSACCRRCGRRSASATRARRSRCRRARSSRSRTRSRTRRCGSPSRAPARSSTRPTAASAASA